MFLELIATVFAGLAAGGLTMLANRITGGRLPKWAVPVVAGLAMIATTITSEYGWYERNTETLPEGLEVIQSVENRSWYRPWTYVAPYVDRFVALDTASLQKNANVPDQSLADLYFFGRWAAVEKLSVLVDCADGRRAALMDGVSFDDAGRVQNAEWVSSGPDDVIIRSVCGVS